VNGKLLLILGLGLFALWSGCRSFSGHESDVEIDWAGRESTVTCDSEGTPIDGPGFLTPQAEEACHDQRKDQRGRAPFWLLVGLGITAYGVVQVRSALSKKK
jgi:hypothetical protein